MAKEYFQDTFQRFVQTLATKTCLSFPFQAWSWEGLFKNLEQSGCETDGAYSISSPTLQKHRKPLSDPIPAMEDFFGGATVLVQNPLVEMAILRYIECYIQPVIASCSCLTSSIPLFSPPQGLGRILGTHHARTQRRHQRIYFAHRHVSVSPVLKLLHYPCQGYIFVLKRMKKKKMMMMMMMMMLADVMVVIS